MKFLKQTFLLALAACLGLGLVGCQPSDPSPPGVAFVTSVAVTPNPVDLEVGGVQALTVTGTFNDGSSWAVTFDSRFASTAPAVARVDAATGYVTALAPGTATITATHGPSGRTASTVVTVAPLQVTSIAIDPATVNLFTGGTQSLNVIATYNNGTTGTVTAGSTFVSSAPAVATVDAAGVVSAVAVGNATITATHTESGKTASAAVTVFAPPSGPFTTITFDEPGVTYTLTGFGGAEDSTLVPDPTGAVNTVAKVVKSAAAELWAGTTASTGPNDSVPPIPFSATETRMTVRVYSPKAGIPVRLKVEDAADPTRSVETEATTTAVNAWQTLTFDFANPAPGTQPLNLAYTYDKVSIFFDFGKSGPDGGDGTYHFDDVTFVTGGSGPSGNTGTCTAPCIDFSSPSVKYEPFEGLVSAAQADDPVDATNKVAKFVKGPAGQPWAGATIYTIDADKSVPEFDLSTNKVVTLRVYAPAAGQKVRLKLEDAANGAIVLEKDAITTVANQWETLSFDFGAPDNGTYDPANTYNRVSVFPLFLTLPTAEVTYYFDELQYTTTSSGPGSGNTGTCSAPCIDFSSADVGYTPFEGLVSAEQADDPVDATNKVAKFVKGPAGQPWAGATIYTVAANQSVPEFDLSTNKVVTLRVYAPAAGQKVRLKLEDAANGAIVLEKDAITTVANQWETLSFDFAAPDNGTYDPANTYDRVSVFPMFLTLPAAEVTYYFDELDYTTPGTGGGPVVFASSYSQLDPLNWKSAEGGDAGTYIDTGVPTQYWWNGVALPPDPTPNFYFGYGISINAKPWGFGAFVKAPGNGTADVSGTANLKIAVWGNDELMDTKPALTLILKGPTVNSCASELRGSVSVPARGVQNYTVALGTFTLQTPCGFASAAEALAAGVAEVHVQVLGANVQYVTGGPVDFANGLNVGPITFE